MGCTSSEGLSDAPGVDLTELREVASLIAAWVSLSWTKDDWAQELSKYEKTLSRFKPQASTRLFRRERAEPDGAVQYSRPTAWSTRRDEAASFGIHNAGNLVTAVFPPSEIICSVEMVQEAINEAQRQGVDVQDVDLLGQHEVIVKSSPQWTDFRVLETLAP